MSLEIDQIAEAFCSYRFVVTYPYLADEIKWNIDGKEELIGREAVIDRCDKSAKFLATVSPTITPKLLPRAGELRKQTTPAEKKLWAYLRLMREDGVRFRRQHAIGAFITDFPHGALRGVRHVIRSSLNSMGANIWSRKCMTAREQNI